MAEDELLFKFGADTSAFDSAVKKVAQALSNLGSGATKAMGDASKGVAESSNAMGGALAGLGANVSKTVESMGKGVAEGSEKFTSAVGGMGEGMAGAGAAVMSSASLLKVGVPAALAAVGVAGLDMASKFEDSTVRIANNSGDTVENAAKIGDSFRELSKTSLSSGQDMVDAYAPVAGQLKEVAGHTLNVGEATGVMKAATDAAAASGEDLKTVLASGADTTQLYQRSLDQLPQTYDTLFNASRATGTSVTDLSDTVNTLRRLLGPTVGSLQDTSSLLVDAGEHGVTGARGLRAFATGLNSLLDPSKAGQDALNQIGLTAEDLFGPDGKFIGAPEAIGKLKNAFDQWAPTLQERMPLEKALFGHGGAAAWDQVLQGGVEGIQHATDVVNQNGTVAKGAAQSNETLGGSFEHLKNTVVSGLTSFGNALTPEAKGVMDLAGRVLTQGVPWFPGPEAPPPPEALFPSEKAPAPLPPPRTPEELQQLPPLPAPTKELPGQAPLAQYPPAAFTPQQRALLPGLFPPGPREAPPTPPPPPGGELFPPGPPPEPKRPFAGPAQLPDVFYTGPDVSKQPDLSQSWKDIAAQHKGPIEDIWGWITDRIKPTGAAAAEMPRPATETIPGGMKGDAGAAAKDAKDAMQKVNAAIGDGLKNASGAVKEAMGGPITAMGDALKGASGTVKEAMVGVTTSIGEPLKSASGNVKSEMDKVGEALKGADGGGAVGKLGGDLKELSTAAAAAASEIQKLASGLKSIHAPSGHGGGGGGGGALPTIGFQEGGSFDPGLFWVGESGPELMSVDRPGQVFNAQDSQQMMGGLSAHLSEQAGKSIGGSLAKSLGLGSGKGHPQGGFVGGQKAGIGIMQFTSHGTPIFHPTPHFGTPDPRQLAVEQQVSATKTELSRSQHGAHSSGKAQHGAHPSEMSVGMPSQPGTGSGTHPQQGTGGGPLPPYDFAKLLGLQHGGALPAHTMALVGEQGPELVQFSAPAHVFPHHQTVRHLRGLAGGTGGSFAVGGDSVTMHAPITINGVQGAAEALPQMQKMIEQNNAALLQGLRRR